MNNLDDYCESLYQRIQTAYERSGNDTGWEMFASPRKVLNGAEVAFLGLNPAGYDFHKPSSSRDFATKCGESAYVDQIWGGASKPGQNKLQLQIRASFKKGGVKPEDVLAGNLVPFRSPRWKRLGTNMADSHPLNYQK